MPEAEDVIVDAARHASAYAIELWRRRRAGAPAADAVTLADVRQRLELLVTAALGARVPIRTAAAPPPRTRLSRWLEPGKRERHRAIVPATDGSAIYLPPRIEDARLPALDTYRVAALQQGMRVVRRAAAAFPWREPPVVQDLYLIAETAAIEAQLAARLPGLERVFAQLRATLLEQHSAAPARSGAAAEVRSVYMRFLATGRLDGLDASSPADSLQWARERAHALPRERRYPGLEPDLLLGTLLEPDAAPSTAPRFADALPDYARELSSARMERRPRVRPADENEDDRDSASPWMVQTTQPHEHAEDAMGMQRPVDKEPDADLQGAGESLSELESLRLVSTPGAAREVLVGEDELAARAARPPAPVESRPGALAYPEWDYIHGGYRERAAIVRVRTAAAGSASWVEAVLARHRATLARVRRRFEALRSRRSVYRAEPDGEDIDLEAFVDAYADRRARLPRTDHVYLAYRPARRDFSLLLLIDVSGSTDAWCGGRHRIIDLEKEALVIVAAALDALGVRFAIQAFSGYGPGDVRVAEVKRFDESCGAAIAQRIAALEPDEFTRVGAALRHATATLARKRAHRRLLLLLSDGKPNDCDRYESRYGFEDARQALAETRLQGVAPFCVTVDHAAPQHLAALFGPGNYSVVSDPRQLAGALLEWLRAVTLALA